MIITCPCGKKFNVDASLIPPEGRLLKCGPCGRKWHYKLENFNKNDKDKKKIVKIKKINRLIFLILTIFFLSLSFLLKFSNL